MVKNKIANITFGYSDSEDRIWVRANLKDHPDVIFWITRRLAENFCNGLGDMLEKKSPLHSIYPKESLPSFIKDEFIHATQSTAEPITQPPRKPDSQIKQLGTCQTIKITPGKNWVITWTVPQHEPYHLPATRKTCFKLVNIMYRLCLGVHWNIKNNHESWLN